MNYILVLICRPRFHDRHTRFLDDSSLNDNANLNRFIDEKVQPDEGFLRNCGAIIDAIYRHLQLEFQRGRQYSVNRMVKVLFEHYIDNWTSACNTHNLGPRKTLSEITLGHEILNQSFVLHSGGGKGVVSLWITMTFHV